MVQVLDPSRSARVRIETNLEKRGISFHELALFYENPFDDPTLIRQNLDLMRVGPGDGPALGYDIDLAQDGIEESNQQGQDH
jgi:hypothetical protein